MTLCVENATERSVRETGEREASRLGCRQPGACSLDTELDEANAPKLKKLDPRVHAEPRVNARGYR
jgi:hypothetical protein